MPFFNIQAGPSTEAAPKRKRKAPVRKSTTTKKGK